MNEIIKQALEIGRISYVDAELVLQKQQHTGEQLESILCEQGLLDSEELDCLATMLLNAFQSDENQWIRWQWRIVQVAWHCKVLPEDSLALPRQLLKRWSRREMMTLAQLLETHGLSKEPALQAEKWLIAKYRVCEYCHLITDDEKPLACPNCRRPLPVKRFASTPVMVDAYDLLDSPKPSYGHDNSRLAQALADWVETRLG